MEHITELAQNIGLFIAGVVIAYTTIRRELKNYFKKQRSIVTDKLPYQSAIDVKITDRLEYVKELLDADIIHIYEFHNGEHYADGRSALKFSCTYESLRAGVETIRTHCLNVPIACMPKFISEILDKGKLTCSDIEKFKEKDPSTYNFKKTLGMESFADYAIRNKDGKIVGFVAIIWKNAKKFEDNEEEIKKLVFYIEEVLLKNINVN